ncbi:MAG: hypothetical protein VKK80_10660 [Prochlorothrix sp.]|nr:hypothetical protein [Prochlorothrix sp.]
MYLVTTHHDRLPQHHQIIMVDGTVPQWVPNLGDLHWDHHCTGGAPIQILDMPLPDTTTLLEERSTGAPPCFTTTQVDADACVAAAWVQLPRAILENVEIVARLQAIAWDCDHLGVPPQLGEWAEFAATVVAALKVGSDRLRQELDLPDDRQQWQLEDRERYYSAAFEQGTEHLMAAARGEQPWPGDLGEAAGYWQQLEADRAQLQQEGRIRLIPTATGPFAVCDLRGLDRYIDPRVFYQVLEAQTDRQTLRPETLTWRDRPEGGQSYTLGSIPLHPRQGDLDYTQGPLKRITEAEQAKSGFSDPWGGRKIVGGSPWNRSSLLTPEEVIAAIDGAVCR